MLGFEINDVDFPLQYVLSGSDDFNLYMWKIPDDLSQSKFALKRLNLIYS